MKITIFFLTGALLSCIVLLVLALICLCGWGIKALGTRYKKWLLRPMKPEPVGAAAVERTPGHPPADNPIPVMTIAESADLPTRAEIAARAMRTGAAESPRK